MLAIEDRSAVDALLAEYGAALDERRYEDWLELFDEQSSYVLQARENFDQSLPLATMRLESKGMLRDRVFGIKNTLFHQPYYQRHVIGVCRSTDAPLDVPGQIDPQDVADESAPATIGAQANYAVFRTKIGGLTEVFNVGRYLMQLRRAESKQTESGLLIRRMHIVFDSELIPNSVIYPV